MSFYCHLCEVLLYFIDEDDFVTADEDRVP